MTTKQLRQIVNELNQGYSLRDYYTLPLSETVFYVETLWHKSIADPNWGPDPNPDSFYLIANETNKYIGIIQVLQEDLHWYILPKHRGKGMLTDALRKSVIGHLLRTRDQIRITIDQEIIGRKNFLSSEKVALSVGFKPSTINSAEYLLTRSEFINENRCSIPEHLSQKRLDYIKKLMEYSAHQYRMIHNEIQLKMGVTEYSEQLEELIIELKFEARRLEIAYWKNRNAI